MARREVKDRFLAALAEGVSVRDACRIAGISRDTVYRWRRRSTRFAAAWDEALERALDRLETVAYRRAFEASDRLLMWILANRRPERWNVRQRVEHSGPDGGPIVVVTGVERDDGAERGAAG